MNNKNEEHRRPQQKQEKHSTFLMNWLNKLFGEEEEIEEEKSKDYFERATNSLDCALNELNIEIQNQRRRIHQHKEKL